MTYLTHLECSVCGDRHSPHELQTVCRSCGKTLIARYDLQAAKAVLKKEALRDQLPSLWKYSALLPIERAENIVSLGERITPITPLPVLGKELGLQDLLMKDEGQLPTGSFKARGLVMAVSKAKELGVKSACMPSAGNAAGALAAYAARAGMESYVFLPEETPEINIKECLVCGAHVELVKGNISDAGKRMNELRKCNPGWFDISTLKEPYRLEGKKTMGYELAEQLGWTVPDVIVYPTGGGTGLIGMWKAFDEMEQLGWIGKKRPRMISVQSSGCAPIVKAFRENKKESQFWEGAVTIASGLRVPKAFADHLILDAIYASGGCAVEVSDEEIVAMTYEFAQKEGLFICPEGAAAFAALRYLVKEGKISGSERVLVFNTAAGIKYPEVVRR
ncbi:MAG: threonine synthase [Ignavibacteria bacterium]|nr:threonine synthase [Ignavibacteria bacterium]